jgi:chemotaxis response regulator CheB
MREMVITTIAEPPDIEIVGDVEPASNLADLVDQMQPDVLWRTVHELRCWPDESQHLINC